LATPNRMLVLFLLFVSMGSRPSYGHFPWLATDDEGRALLFFGESPDDREYHLPEAVAAAKAFARVNDEKPVEFELPTVEEDGFIGRRSVEPAPKDAVLEMTCEYGLYHSMLLTYYAKHLPGNDAATWEEVGRSKNLNLDIAPKATDDAITLSVTWNGKPLKDAAVTLADSSGEAHEGTTDDRGEASFKNVAHGLVGVTANFMDDVRGELDGKPYQSAGYYATLTFRYGDNLNDAADASSAGASGKALPDLPEPLASFGAAVCDGWLYIYGGHIGTEHDHSRDNLSPHFRRIEIAGGRQWEDLPMQTPLQGLPLVAHDGKLYRVGGLSARNASGEKEDLHSVGEFARFDPQTKTWTELTPLPEPRSSHDATVIEGVLYVLGGWRLEGSSKGKWLDTSWSFDLDDPDGKWRPLPSPGFRRRALAVSHWQGKLIAIGGIGEDRKVSRRLDALDLKKGEWSQLPKLPGKGIDGFGVAACNLGEELYVSGTQDWLYRLAATDAGWEAVAKLHVPRFFHRLVPGKDAALLAVAGASEEGHVASIEELMPNRRPALEQ